MEKALEALKLMTETYLNTLKMTNQLLDNIERFAKSKIESNEKIIAAIGGKHD